MTRQLSDRSLDDRWDRVVTMRYACDPRGGRHPHARHGGKFIKGPIPFTWMATAHTLPGKAGAIGLSLWFLRGVRKAETFAVSREAMQLAGCQRGTYYKALNVLESAGLIRQRRRPGRRTLVTLVIDRAHPDGHGIQGPSSL